MIKFLQVCNVGQINGGTGACAWSVTRALPEFQHEVWSMTAPTEETRRVFHPILIRKPAQRLEFAIREADADVVLLHNISRRQLAEVPEIPSINYLHSKIDPARTLRRMVCSEYLNQMYGCREKVVWQGVPRAIRKRDGGETFGLRELRREMIVGRLCTPVGRKWWPGLPAFYHRLASELPEIWWEFVGCPEDVKGELAEACGGRVRFFNAGWGARSRMWDWDVLLYHHPGLPETFGRTVAEACRAGCIPVVDRAGGFVEQLEEGPGFLCGDEGEFRGALRILQDQGERWKRSRACREWGEVRFSLVVFRGRLLTEIRELINRAKCDDQAA